MKMFKKQNKKKQNTKFINKIIRNYMNLHTCSKRSRTKYIRIIHIHTGMPTCIYTVCTYVHAVIALPQTYTSGK